MSTSQELHVVFGAGQVGPHVATRIAATGRPVRMVRRSAATVNLSGVQFIRAEATDPAAVAEAVRGASVVYHCMNPAYSTAVWADQLPRIQENLVAACGRAGARLVVLNNVYALGRPGGKALSEATPLAPCSRKGEIRARLHQALGEAVRRGDVKAVTGMASDFYGPDGAWTNFADRFWPQALAGKPATLVVNPDMPHTWHYIPDVASGLATLGLDATAEGTFMLPCHPAEPARALVDRFGAALGHPIAVRRMSPWLLKGLGLVVPIVRELVEMGYQWEEPFAVDDSRFRARYGDLAAPLDVAARATVAWAQATWGAGARKAA
jgi:nucleoside-diphosphate-sugar epimerase